MQLVQVWCHLAKVMLLYIRLERVSERWLSDDINLNDSVIVISNSTWPVQLGLSWLLEGAVEIFSFMNFTYINISIFSWQLSDEWGQVPPEGCRLNHISSLETKATACLPRKTDHKRHKPSAAIINYDDVPKWWWLTKPNSYLPFTDPARYVSNLSAQCGHIGRQRWCAAASPASSIPLVCT